MHGYDEMGYDLFYMSSDFNEQATSISIKIDLNDGF